jgi:hypothetical protein
MALLKLAFEAGVFLCALWLLAVACLAIAAGRAGRELDDVLPDYPEPPSFPAVGSRGGTKAMDAVGAEVDQMLRDSGGSDRDD